MPRIGRARGWPWLDHADLALSRPMTRERVAYLEGLRGVAAIQVVLLHAVTAFLPDTAEHAPPPLRVLWDGHTAVYVFFLISGAVLTGSFARGGPWQRQVAKRLVRLGLPVAAAAVIALLLIALLPEAHRKAARVSASAWLAMDSSGAATLAHLLREISLDSLLLGYREYTLFAPIADRLPLLEQSLDAPFWSLHLELYGSLLVLGLTRLRSRSAPMHAAVVVLCAVLFGAHPMFLFVLGHLAAGRLGRPPIRLIGSALFLLGLLLSARKDWAGVELLRTVVDRIQPAGAPNLFQFQSQIAAIALFCGATLSGPVQAAFGCRACRYLGGLSFSIYLLHFPILFTLACAGFLGLAGLLPEPLAVALTMAGFGAVTLLAAWLFERWIDRPAIRLSRMMDPPPRPPATRWRDH